MNNIYLIGMMGSGKSVTGKALAAILQYGFTDLDVEIEKKEGRTISEVFAKSGEPYFRDIESEMLRGWSVKDHYVFSTGGGIVLRDENVKIMKATGRVVLLETSLEILWERLCQKKDRPLLQTVDPKGTLKNIFEAREEKYKTASDIRILTDGLTAQAAAKGIITLLK